MKLRTLATIAPVIMAACAPPASRINAAAVPESAYANLDCSQLEAEHAKVLSQLDGASRSQDSAATSDAVSVFLIGVPVSPVTGEDRASTVAVLKGQADAIGQARFRKGCYG